MNSESFQELEALFHETLEQPASEREEFLDKRCQKNPEMKEKLLGLLRQEATDEGAVLPKPFHAAGTWKIGPYTILETIGEGGFSLVYLAQQEEPLQRKIALKILKPGLDTHATLARFEAERQALAVMNHDGIARIFDAGATDHGRPFFAMEYVRGVPITEYCDERKLSNEDRLRLFTDVCNAVHHAHQKGVIHRDLKPSNILVAERDGKAQVKVIDFGIAKATSAGEEDEGLFTLQGQLVGTPEYMSPEQAGFGPGDVDTRTDIYSLGVVLYELLTGVQPFSGQTLRQAGFAEIQRIIREDDPPRPSARVSTLGADSAEVARLHRLAPRGLIRQLRGELDWVVLKAMEKDRDRRYASPFDLGNDISRFLQHKPLEARPPTRMYRLSKFGRRNKLALVMFGALTLGLFGLTAGVTVALVQANHQRKQTEKSLTEVQLARDEAQAVTAFLGDMLGAARPYEMGRDVTVMAVLDSTVSNLDRDLGDRPLIATQVRRTIGIAYADLGMTEKADPLLRQALEDHQKLLGPEHEQTLLSLGEVADLLMLQDRNDEADSLYSIQLEIYERTLGSGHQRTLSAIHQRGSAMVEMNRYVEAESLLVQSWRGAQTAFDHDSQAYLSFGSNLANYYAEVGRPDEAEPLLYRVLEGRIRNRGEEHSEVMESWSNLAMLYADQGRFQECIPPLRRAHLLQDKLLGPAHFEALVVRNNLAAISGLIFDWAAAETLYLEGVQLVRDHHEPSERITQHLINNLGYLALQMGQWDRAEKLLQESYELRLETFGARHRDTGVSVNNLGELAMLQGNLIRAGKLHRENLEMRSEMLGPEHQHTLISMVNLGRVWALQGKDSQADSMLSAAREIARRTLPRGHRATINATCHWGRHRLAMGEANSVRGVIQPMVAVADSALVPNDPLRGAIRVQMAVCEQQAGDEAKAAKWLQGVEDLVPAELTAATPWRRDFLLVKK